MERLAKRLQNAQENQKREQIAVGDRRNREIVRQDFVLVREYAHATRPDRRPNDRVDFAETLYWNAGVKTDEKTGNGYVSFSTSDAVTAFRVSADAYSSSALGTASSVIKSVQPFYVEVKMPLEVTQGDEMRLRHFRAAF